VHPPRPGPAGCCRPCARRPQRAAAAASPAWEAHGRPDAARRLSTMSFSGSEGCSWWRVACHASNSTIGWRSARASGVWMRMHKTGRIRVGLFDTSQVPTLPAPALQEPAAGQRALRCHPAQRDDLPAPRVLRPHADLILLQLRRLAQQPAQLRRCGPPHAPSRARTQRPCGAPGTDSGVARL